MATSDSRPERGVVAVVHRKKRLLVIQRSQHVVAPGKFCFPGGGIQDGESEEQALVREMQEELGVGSRPLRRIWQSVTPWNVMLAWWSTEIIAPDAICPNAAEVASFHWLDPAELKSHPELLPSNYEFLEAWERDQLASRL